MRSTGPCFAVIGASAREDAVRDVAGHDVELRVVAACCARFARLPVEKSSSTTTRWPRSMSAIDGVRADEAGAAGDDDDGQARR